jgi:hypothetical protein
VHKDSVFAFTYAEKNVKSEGYRAIIRYENGFIAAGSDGRIDWISASAKIIKSEKISGENFNCLLSDDNAIVAAGDNGTILISSEMGVFRKIESGTNMNINSLALLHHTIIAGADQGEIISGDIKGFFRKIHLDLKGNIVSVSARTSDCFGVTDEGEIIHSTDGIYWDILDFNQAYSGFYKPCHFNKILATENQIAVAGIRNDGSPVFMFSSQGNVWTEKPLIYNDEQGMPGLLEDSPNDMYYDNTGNQFFLVCCNGKLLKLPSCSQCNKLAVISADDLEGISCNEDTVMIVGENFLVRTLKL